MEPPHLYKDSSLKAFEGNMVGGLKVLTVKSGREREFEALFTELRNEMHKHEPGCLLYSLLKSCKSSLDYIVREQYVDQAALDFHSQSAHGALYFPRMRALFDKIDVEYFDGVVS